MAMTGVMRVTSTTMAVIMSNTCLMENNTKPNTKEKNCFNPLTSSSDWHLISPNHVNPESNIKVRRMKELISDKKGS